MLHGGVPAQILMVAIIWVSAALSTRFKCFAFAHNITLAWLGLLAFRVRLSVCLSVFVDAVTVRAHTLQGQRRYIRPFSSE